MTILFINMMFEYHSTNNKAISGNLPDGKNIVSRARDEAKGYKQNYGIEING